MRLLLDNLATFNNIYVCGRDYDLFVDQPDFYSSEHFIADSLSLSHFNRHSLPNWNLIFLNGNLVFLHGNLVFFLNGNLIFIDGNLVFLHRNIVFHNGNIVSNFNRDSLFNRNIAFHW